MDRESTKSSIQVSDAYAQGHTEFWLLSTIKYFIFVEYI